MLVRVQETFGRCAEIGFVGGSVAVKAVVFRSCEEVVESGIGDDEGLFIAGKGRGLALGGEGGDVVGVAVAVFVFGSFVRKIWE